MRAAAERAREEQEAPATPALAEAGVQSPGEVRSDG